MNQPTQVTDAESSRAAPARSIPDARRPRAVPRLWLAAFALVALGLVIAAVVGRFRVPRHVALQWVPVIRNEIPGSAVPVPYRPEISDATRWTSAEMGTRAGGTLDDIGDRLDSPDFGNTQHSQQPRQTVADVIPPERRWRIVFAPGLTEGQYAREIDALGLELGVLGDDGKLEYVLGLDQSEPKRRSGTLASENRLYFTWDRGDLIDADRILLANLRLKLGDRIILHFCSKETVDKLAALERDYQGRESAEILRTKFSVKQTFRGHEVYVLEQQLRESVGKEKKQ